MADRLMCQNYDLFFFPKLREVHIRKHGKSIKVAKLST